MAALSTVAPAFALSAAIRRIGSSKASLIGTIGPILTIALGWWILDEPMSVWQLVGTALVVGGVVLVSSGRGSV
jgi:drug/metabolite transporter (DMT)-like permease